MSIRASLCHAISKQQKVPDQRAQANSDLSTAALYFAMVPTLLLVPFFGALSAYAAPSSSLVARSVTALSAAQISEYTPYTHYASTAFCNPSTTLTWTCGGAYLLVHIVDTTATNGGGNCSQL